MFAWLVGFGVCGMGYTVGVVRIETSSMHFGRKVHDLGIRVLGFGVGTYGLVSCVISCGGGEFGLGFGLRAGYSAWG